jgi:murein L,D-transpeptidase YcbB/YkuD
MVFRTPISVVLLSTLVACTDSAVSSPAVSESSSSLALRGPEVPQRPAGSMEEAIAAALKEDKDSAGGVPSSAEHRHVVNFYERGGFLPVWIDGKGRPNNDAREALVLLRDAAAEGLDPADYRAGVLDSLAAELDATSTPSVSDLAVFDTRLSSSMLTYLRQLHTGRIDPRAVGFAVDPAAEEHDFASLLHSGIAEHRVAATARELAPPLALYRGLRSMLARYRSLAADQTLAALPMSASTIRPGDPYDGGALGRWLVAFGDLPADTTFSTESTYDGVLVEGVKHFQMRHGLEADGVLGKGTQAALRVPLAGRVRQIELALERLRWLPDLSRNRFLAVNIPMFRLWVWDSIPPDGAPSFGMGVIVGRALNTRTPVFVEEMSSVIFRPYWNVPSSILRGEILPVLRRDPNYLQRQDMEIVRGAGDDARPVALTEHVLDELQRGELRVRQRPGPKNALGLVKFVFPNDQNVYMHGTPAQQLFGRPRRDFSHGCVRVEDPIALAEWALEGQDDWSRDRILAAMNGAQPLSVTLTRPIQVILFYVTAVVMPDDGTVRFSEDIYGHDRRLDSALEKRRRPR